MGEAKIKGKQERERFEPGVVALSDVQTGGKAFFWIDHHGFVFVLRIGARVHELGIVMAVREAQRQSGKSSATKP